MDLAESVDKYGRKEHLAEWIKNKNEIFSEKNLNKIEAIYGSNFREALEDSLYRMEHGKHRPTGKFRMLNQWSNWLNNSVGAIMFLNTRSAVLQTLSMVNFIDWKDNNVFAAAKAFANQPQFWKDFSMIFNSDMLKQRRSGLQHDINANEIAGAIKNSKNKYRAALNWKRFCANTDCG